MRNKSKKHWKTKIEEELAVVMKASSARLDLE